jgi:hypothetical protein
MEDDMANIRARWIAVCCFLSLAFVPSAGSSQENDQLLATASKPATIIAKPVASPGNVAAAPSRSPRVVVSVTHYRPTEDGSPLDVVVTARAGNGAEQEIGRFGITPDREFAVADPSAAQRFGFALPRSLMDATSVVFNVRLVPARGDGKGASLRIGGVEIR